MGNLWRPYGGTRCEGQDPREIRESDALFFVLSGDGEFFTRSKAWFPWAADVAQDKDIWVFEHSEDLKRVPVLIPRLGNYVAYYITNAWSDFVLKIAETYEKPKAARAALPEAVLVPLDGAQESSSFDPATGRALLDDSTCRPMALSARCPVCSSAYNLYIPSEMRAIRCPSCGHFYRVHRNAPAPAPVPA